LNCNERGIDPKLGRLPANELEAFSSIRRRQIRFIEQKGCQMEAGYVRAGAFFDTAAVSNAVAVIVPPTNNLYGIIIRTCMMVLTAAGNNAVGSLVADTVAPTGVNNGRIIAGMNVGPNTTVSQIVPYQIFVPPGLGLWWAATAAATGSMNSAFLTYDLVQPA
jgi:hypothetical protein